MSKLGSLEKRNLSRFPLKSLGCCVEGGAAAALGSERLGSVGAALPQVGVSTDTSSVRAEASPAQPRRLSVRSAWDIVGAQ